jgi:periplasmic copper chaperone A
MKTTLYLMLSVMALTAAACSKPGTTSEGLSVSEAWARPGIAGGNSAVYFMIDNPGSQDDTLLNASSDVAEASELHMTSISSDDTASMHHQMSVPIPAGEITVFEPGGLHVMLINLQRDLTDGETITLVLKFKNAGELQLEVPVKLE